MLVFWNGALYNDAEVPIAPTDRSLLLGEGVFETLRIYERKPFTLGRHIVRLRQGCAHFGFPPLPPDDYFIRAIDNVIGANEIHDGRLRITVTGGSGPLGVQRANEETNILITVGKLGGIAASATIGIAPWRMSSRSAIAGIKSTSFGQSVISLNWANEHGYQEALFLNEYDNVVETTASNIFLVFEGQLYTPPLGSGCLPGITRELILENMEVNERDISHAQLRYAEEGFLTSSLREVQPIAAVGGRLLNMNGPHTDKARGIIDSLVNAEIYG